MSIKRKSGSVGKPKTTRKSARKPTKPKGIRVEGVVRVHAYDVIREAVEKGTKYAMGRAFKYSETPKGWTAETSDRIEDAVAESVMNELCYILNFDGTR